MIYKTIDPNVAQFLEGIVGVVEANRFEQIVLWEENRRSEKPKTWESDHGGYLPTIGHINKRPICLSLFKARIDGHWILFVEPTSQLVDYKMIDEWLTVALPKTAFRKDLDGYLNKIDASNFYIIFNSLKGQ